MKRIGKIVVSLLLATGLADAALAQPAQGDGRLAAAFKGMDKDVDGILSAAEWAAAGRREAGFRRVDANGDGKVTLDELQVAAARRQGK